MCTHLINANRVFHLSAGLILCFTFTTFSTNENVIPIDINATTLLDDFSLLCLKIHLEQQTNSMIIDTKHCPWFVFRGISGTS